MDSCPDTNIDPKISHLGCGRWRVLATTLAATAFSHTATTTRLILVNVTLK